MAFSQKVATILLASLCVLQPAWAANHGGGGGEGEGGGGSSGGTSGESEGSDAGRASSNPEESSSPDGFSLRSTSSYRSYVATPNPMPPNIVQFLRAQGQVSESEQNDRSAKDWSERASEKSKSQWSNHQSTAYVIALRLGGISVVDSKALSATQTSGVSSALADKAWLQATSQSKSAANSVTSALGRQSQLSVQFQSTRTAAALKNLSK